MNYFNTFQSYNFIDQTTLTVAMEWNAILTLHVLSLCGVIDFSSLQQYKWCLLFSSDQDVLTF